MDRRLFLETVGSIAVAYNFDFPCGEGLGGINEPVKVEGKKFFGHLMTVDKVNSNGHYYPKVVVEKTLQKVNQYISEKRFFVQSVSDSCLIHFDKMCGIVEEISWKDNNIFFKGEMICCNHPNAEAVHNLMREGIVRVGPVGMCSHSESGEASNDYKLLYLATYTKSDICKW